MLQYLNPIYIKNRIVREFTEMSKARKITYAVVFLVLIGLSVYFIAADPFSVHTGTTTIVKKHK